MSNNKYIINDLKLHAKENNGECLSDTYVNGLIKIHWLCNICGEKWCYSLCNTLLEKRHKRLS